MNATKARRHQKSVGRFSASSYVGLNQPDVIDVLVSITGGRIQAGALTATSSPSWCELTGREELLNLFSAVDGTAS